MQLENFSLCFRCLDEEKTETKLRSSKPGPVEASLKKQCVFIIFKEIIFYL
jgi:hypothetical protein